MTGQGLLALPLDSSPGTGRQWTTGTQKTWALGLRCHSPQPAVCPRATNGTSLSLRLLNYLIRGIRLPVQEAPPVLSVSSWRRQQRQLPALPHT